MLTDEQVQSYENAGYLLVSGLIPAEIAAAAEAAMWRLLQVSPTEPHSWAALSQDHDSFESPELVACYTPAFLSAAARLSSDDPGTFRAPRSAYTINLFPQPG